MGRLRCHLIGCDRLQILRRGIKMPFEGDPEGALGI